jgi:predicted adenine nucleotide alpha hydrolase (AANH) superfamily ATPase
MTDQAIFLHVCCGPCAEYPVKVLREEGYRIQGYFYNPNIQPAEEYERREEGVKLFSELHAVPMLYEGMSEEAIWRSFPSSLRSKHCEACYGMRMEQVAKRCKEEGYPAFTTSLTVSLWQDHEAIIRAGQRAAEHHGVEFKYFDFRSGYREGQNMAREDGLYRQKYCGCIYSLRETKFTDKICEELGIDPASLPERIDDLA